MTVLMFHRTLYDEDRNVSHGRGTSPENKFKVQNFERTVVARGGTVVKVLCYKPEGRWFDGVFGIFY